jgi:hypothetical protein
MNVFFHVVLFCACLGRIHGIDETSIKSLREFMFALHPAGARRAASRQSETGVPGRSRKIAAMNDDDSVGLDALNDIMDAAVEADGGEVETTKKFDVKDLAGITPPIGFFDPVGFTTDASEGKIRFYREVELKHGRVGMLAALGFLVGENFHPLFGGNIDVPAYLAFQQTPLQTFWGAVLFAIAIPETFSVFSFNSPFGGEPWTIRSDYEPGNLGFDPLNLKPTDPAALKEMQNKELNNGRLAMLAAAGMIAQELATGQKLF